MISDSNISISDIVRVITQHIEMQSYCAEKQKL